MVKDALGDYSGIAPLASLLTSRNTKPEEKMAIVEALAIIDQDEAVEPLTRLLSDKDADVRLAAAYAFADMTRALALEGMAKALAVDYTSTSGENRNGPVQAHLIRYSAQQFAKDPRTKTLIDSAKQSPYPSVRFLALSLASAPVPARKK